MLPIGFAPAIPDSRPAARVPAVPAVAETHAVRRTSGHGSPARRVTVTVEPAETVHPLRVGVGMLIDTFA